LTGKTGGSRPKPEKKKREKNLSNSDQRHQQLRMRGRGQLVEVSLTVVCARGRKGKTGQVKLCKMGGRARTKIAGPEQPLNKRERKTEHLAEASPGLDKKRKD